MPSGDSRRRISAMAAGTSAKTHRPKVMTMVSKDASGKPVRAALARWKRRSGGMLSNVAARACARRSMAPLSSSASSEVIRSVSG